MICYFLDGTNSANYRHSKKKENELEFAVEKVADSVPPFFYLGNVCMFYSSLFRSENQGLISYFFCEL